MAMLVPTRHGILSEDAGDREHLLVCAACRELLASLGRIVTEVIGREFPEKEMVREWFSTGRLPEKTIERLKRSGLRRSPGVAVFTRANKSIRSPPPPTRNTRAS